MAKECIIPIASGKKVSFKKTNTFNEFTVTFQKNVKDIRMFPNNEHFIALLEDGSIHYRKGPITRVWKRNANIFKSKISNIQVVDENQFVLNFETDKRSEIRSTRDCSLIKTLY